MTTNVSNASTIEVNTSVTLSSVIGAGPSTTSVTIVDSSNSVTFEAYEQGQAIVAASSSYQVTSSSTFVSLYSDQPLDITVTPSGDSAYTIAASQRFSYQGAVAIEVSVANTSAESANLDYVATT